MCRQDIDSILHRLPLASVFGAPYTISPSDVGRAIAFAVWSINVLLLGVSLEEVNSLVENVACH